MSTDYFEGVEIETVETEAASPEAAEKVEPAPEPEAVTEEAAPETDDAENPDAEESNGDEPFPKKAVNAISKRDRKIHNLRKEREALQAEIESLKAKTEGAQDEADEAPKEEDFDMYSDFLKAQSEYIAKQTFKQSSQDQDKAKLDTLEQKQKEVWIAERAEHMEQSDEAARAEYADFDAVVDANAQVAEYVAQNKPELLEAFLQLDNPSKAFYNLAKEGKLESLLQMPSNIAVVELVQAQYRNSAPVKADAPAPTVEQPVSAAPAPLKAAKGAASTSQKPLEKLNADELYDRLMG